jgi:chitin disaccharide deacetylase
MNAGAPLHETGWALRDLSAAEARARLIVTSDDLGVSPGVNEAILEAAAEGGLTHASAFANGAFIREAVAALPVGLPLKIGFHVNLTSGKALCPPQRIPRLARPDGTFRSGFMGLWKLSLSREAAALAAEIRLEIGAQLLRLREMGIEPTHIDGHRHVQMIPLVFGIVRETAGAEGIGRIRVTNDSLVRTVRSSPSFSFLFDGGLVKYFLLHHFYKANGYKTPVYFFSILHTCRLNRRLLEGLVVPPGFRQAEIMLHPGKPDVDRALGMTDPHLLSPHRTEELLTALRLAEILRG